VIFVTVGTQLPFPRLIAQMDEIAGRLDEDVFAQTGPDAGDVKHLKTLTQLTPPEFEEKFRTARVVVAHAGIGTILSAKRYGKPVILLPRRADLGEHRNDHQLATARQVEKLTGVHVAWEADDLEALIAREALEPANEEMSATHQALVDRLSAFISA
jgi:UDP-N-acetylglucosamine transferase subunit ALG13